MTDTGGVQRFPAGSVTDPAACLICHLGEVEDDAVVFRNDLWACEIAPGFEVPGWYFLRARRHALGWTELGSEELTSFGPTVHDLMAGLQLAFDAPARYLMTFGEAYPHFHCIVVVRGDDVPADRRSGNILGLLQTDVDRTAALARVPSVRAALDRATARVG